MLGNLNMWDANNVETEGINRSDSEHLSMAICEKSMDKATTLVSRYFELKFLDEVSDPVYTGIEIKGKEDTDIVIALFDEVTGDLVDSRPESFARAEILFLDHDFNNKPQFCTPVFVHLENGIGILPNNLKIPHTCLYTKRSKCRLGARVVEIFDGSRIKEASTESFTVLDRRSKSCKNRDQPSLFDDVRTLKNIGKSGVRRNRLLMNNVSTVQEFLFLHSVDPQGLQKIFGASHGTLMRTVEHARKCNIDDQRIYYLQYSSSSSSECRNGVVFDVVGKLKGVLRNTTYVPIQSVSKDEEDDARKLLAYAFKNQKEAPASRNKKKASAFENWNDIASFDDEASFLCNFPSISNSFCHFGPSSSRNVSSLPEPSSGTIRKDQGFPMSDFGESNDNNATNSTGLASFDEASFLHNFPSISNDKNATNSTGLDGHFGHHSGNTDYLDQQPSELVNPFSDPPPLWSFDDNYYLLM